MTGPSNQISAHQPNHTAKRHFSARLAAELGMERKVVKRLLRGEEPTVTIVCADRVP